MIGLKNWLEQTLQGNDLPLNIPAKAQDLHGISVDEVMQAHAAWRDRLELTLRGQNPDEYDPAVVGADHLCKFGQWLHGDGQVLKNYPEFAELLEAHKQFHAIAGSILENHKKGKLADAMILLRKDLVEASKQAKIALVTLVLAIYGG